MYILNSYKNIDVLNRFPSKMHAVQFHTINKEARERYLERIKSHTKDNHMKKSRAYKNQNLHAEVELKVQEISLMVPSNHTSDAQ